MNGVVSGKTATLTLSVENGLEVGIRTSKTADAGRVLTEAGSWLTVAKIGKCTRFGSAFRHGTLLGSNHCFSCQPPGSTRGVSSYIHGQKRYIGFRG